MPRTKNKTYEEQRISRIRMYGIDVPDYERMLEMRRDGYTFTEIAARFDVSPQAVQIAYKRAQAKRDTEGRG